MTYQLRIKASAQRRLERLDKSSRDRVHKVIKGLAENPRPFGYVQLSGQDGLYRVRAGDYRVVYSIDGQQLIVIVVLIAHRREVYRRL